MSLTILFSAIHGKIVRFVWSCAHKCIMCAQIGSDGPTWKWWESCQFKTKTSKCVTTIVEYLSTCWSPSIFPFTMLIFWYVGRQEQERQTNYQIEYQSQVEALKCCTFFKTVHARIILPSYIGPKNPTWHDFRHQQKQSSMRCDTSAYTSSDIWAFNDGMGIWPICM